jgi:uncharacterized phage-associated protein
MMVFFDRQLLFDDEPQAWVNGPVYPTVYERFKSISRYDMMSRNDFVPEGSITEGIDSLEKRLGLTESQFDVLHKLIAIYGSKNQDQLVFMTHCEDPWSIARGDLGPFENSDNPISFEDMYSFYKARYEANRRARG